MSHRSADFLEAISTRLVLGDGAMGTLLHTRGVPPTSCLEELCASAPGQIEAIHREYLAAGAEVVRTHSLGSNAQRLAQHGLARRVSELNWLAARIAREAVKGTSAWVAASVGPAGAGWSRAIFEEQIGALLDGGADFVLLETFTDLDELLAAVEAKHTLHHCPVVASLAWNDPAKIAAAAAALRAAQVDVVGVNCAGDPAATRAALARLDPCEPVAAFPSTGRALLDAEAFAEAALELRVWGVRFLGGCCGTTPAHLAALAARLAP
jgi:homocysteine S-methyltransferase